MGRSSLSMAFLLWGAADQVQTARVKAISAKMKGMTSPAISLCEHFRIDNVESDAFQRRAWE